MTTPAAPPRLAAWLLGLFTIGPRAEEIRGDFAEAFVRWHRDDPRRASRRFRREVLALASRRLARRWSGAHVPAPLRLGQDSGGGWGRDAAADIRFVLRGFRRTPGFAAVAVGILALGIGANATMFTLVHDLFFRPPAEVQAPERLIRLDRVRPEGVTSSFGYADYAFLRDNSEVFTGLLAYDEAVAIAVVGAPEAGEVSQASVMAVSYNYFDVLGVRVAAGRGFVEAEGRTPLTHPVVVLSHGFWRRHFGSDEAAVGQQLVLNGRAFTIVGVAPRAFRGVNPVEASADMYIPIMMQGAVSPGAETMLPLTNGSVSYWLQVIGRLRPGVSVASAQAAVDVVRARFLEEFAPWVEATNPNPFRIGVNETFHLGPQTRDSMRQLAALLFAVVAAVLVIASVNLALLLLARASARHRELGIRLALGAGRGRIVRQLMTESLLLAAVGAAGGLVLATWGARFAASLMPLQFSVDFRPGGMVLAFTTVLAAVTALGFGLVPAFHAAHSDTLAAVNRGEPEQRRTRLRHALVVAQFALSMALVAGAGLFVRSLRTAESVDLGFEPRNKLTVSVQLGNHGYNLPTGRVYLRTALDALRGLPGVTGASATLQTPFRGGWSSRVTAPGTAYAETAYDAGFNRVAPGYFETIGTPLVAGREFTAADDESAPPVVVVNEVAAEQLWPGRDPIGQTITRGGAQAEVIGVARTAMYYEVGETPGSQIYIPYLQQFSPRITFLVATGGAPRAVLPEVERTLRAIDPAVALYNVRTLGEVVGQEVGRYRVMAILVTLFGGLALLLAAVGEFGVQSYLVSRRTREIGVRMALGAAGRQVVALVVGRGVGLAALGGAVGLAAALSLSHLIQGMLYGISARDPLTFVVVPAILLVVSLAANVVPARRASRVDPIEALREE